MHTYYYDISMPITFEYSSYMYVLRSLHTIAYTSAHNTRHLDNTATHIIHSPASPSSTRTPSTTKATRPTPRPTRPSLLSCMVVSNNTLNQDLTGLRSTDKLG